MWQVKQYSYIFGEASVDKIVENSESFPISLALPSSRRNVNSLRVLSRANTANYSQETFLHGRAC